MVLLFFIYNSVENESFDHWLKLKGVSQFTKFKKKHVVNIQVVEVATLLNGND